MNSGGATIYSLTEISARSPELRPLIAALDAYQHSLYPPASQHSIALHALAEDRVRCILVRDERGRAMGCGAVVFDDEQAGEIKRVYLNPDCRGQRLGEKVLVALETLARDAGCMLLRLETGIHQPAAIQLYQRCGYGFCAPFFPYHADPLSVFMMKALS